ncbi:DUF1614 domain-containing protein [Methanopyrus sp.]
MNGHVIHSPTSRAFLLFLSAWLFLSFLMTFLYFVSIPGFFHALGLEPKTALLLSLLSIVGSAVNVPIKRIRKLVTVQHETFGFWGISYQVPVRRSEEIVIAVNVGGCLIPIAVSVYLIATNLDLWLQYLLATAVTTVVSYATARVIPGVGIAVPFFLPATVAGTVALLTAKGGAASVAYVAGTLGTLIGADLLNLRKAVNWGDAPVLSIGGAGTFDAVFVTGLTAVWIAYVLSPGAGA